MSCGQFGYASQVEIFPTDTSRHDKAYRQRHDDEYVYTFHIQDDRIDPFTRKLLKDAWERIHGSSRQGVTDRVYGIDLCGGRHD